MSFDVERVSSFVLSADEQEALWVELEPEGERFDLVRAEASGSASPPLTEPTGEALEFARQVSAWIMSGDADRLSSASVHRPVRGAYSRDDWAEKAGFIANRVGDEARLIEEAWVLRDGLWRYWRTFESSGGMEIVLRFGVSADGKVLSYGINPRGAEPAFAEKILVGSQASNEVRPRSDLVH